MADWEEVKRLAADFQRAQLSSTVQKLSERNCIELVSKLVNEFKLIDVIYTSDGKEYLTHQEVTKEIREELQVHSGRINLVELQQIINIDFSHVELKAKDIVKNDKNIILILGQLIDKDYLDNLCDEVNDKLQDEGQVKVAELTKIYDLPADFLSETLHERLGSRIKGQVDSSNKDIIFTRAFVERHHSQIRGIFTASSRPTSVSAIISQYGFQDRLFYSIMDDLIGSSRLAGTLGAGRQSYVPDIYTRSQNDWVDSFYKQNGYLEYDSLTRLGISDAKGFIKKRFKTEPLTYLGTCATGRGIQDQIDATVEEALRSKSWVDIMPVLPSVLSPADAAQLLHQSVKSHSHAAVLADTIVASEAFINDLMKPFDELMADKADQDAKMNAQLLSSHGDRSQHLEGLDDKSAGKENRKDDRRKKAAGVSKSGSGTQGREVRSKAVKKKYKPGGKGGELHVGDSDEEYTASRVSKDSAVEIKFMSPEEIAQELHKTLPDCSDEFIEEISHKLYRPLTNKYQEVAKSIFLQSPGVNKNKSSTELQEKVTSLWTNVKLFEKGIKLFNEDVQIQLNKHLLRTLCSDLTNIALSNIAADNMISVDQCATITPEIRVKLVSKLPEPAKSALTKLHGALNEKNLDNFHEGFNLICGNSYLGILLRKIDKKKERQLMYHHRQLLTEQLKYETDPALCLHLSSVLMFQASTQCMVHLPGRLVPHLVVFLKDHLTAEQYNQLFITQDHVVQQIRKKNDGNSVDLKIINEELSALIPQIKEIALVGNKRTTSQTLED